MEEREGGRRRERVGVKEGRKRFMLKENRREGAEVKERRKRFMLKENRERRQKETKERGK